MNLAVQALGLVGAALVLSAYVAIQRGWFTSDGVAYHALNAAGAAILLGVAWVQRSAGFIVRNGAWLLVALAGLRATRSQGSNAVDARRAD